MNQLILSLLILCGNAFAQIYTNNSVSVSVLRDTNDIDSYFGYAVFLQSGNPARVIVGAPKYGSKKVGSVYVCPVGNEQNLNSDNCDTFTLKNEKANIAYANNLFGAAIDGGTNQNDVVMIAAPKYTVVTPDNYYAIGGVFNLTDLQNGIQLKYPKRTEAYVTGGLQNPLINEYLYGLSQYGFATHFINNSDFLYGAPGYSHWRGQAFHSFQAEYEYQVPEARRYEIVQKKARRSRRDVTEKTNSIIDYSFLNADTPDESSLAGYAVTTGNFFGHLSYVIGMPSNNEMEGSVKLYRHDANVIRPEVTVVSRHPQIGEHFGSALCAADVNGDGADDLLIGAPNYGVMNSYDDGRVYLYLSDAQGNLVFHQIIVGCITCRFGTSIKNLGKITLDHYEAVAIGSPYEDGIGAVKVYVWSKASDELKLESKVQLDTFKAFGYSLSRAVDIDANNIADFAVGDYGSNSVAILKAKSVFFYNVTVDYPTLYADADRTDTKFDIKICIVITGFKTAIKTEIRFEFDPRLKHNYPALSSRVILNTYCQRVSLEFNTDAPRVEPLSINILLDEEHCDTCAVASPTYLKHFYKKIPFNYNCKGEVCLPEITVQSNLPEKYVVGESDTLDVVVSVQNKGDPAFVCALDISTEPVVQKTARGTNCEGTNCVFNHIIREILLTYTLHFDSFSRFDKFLKIEVTTNCVNVSSAATTFLQLDYIHNLDVEAIEQTQQYDSINMSTFDVRGEFLFLIRNEGPSSLEEDVFVVKIPRISHDVQVVDIYRPSEQDGYFLETDQLFDTPVIEQIPAGPGDNTNDVAPAGFTHGANLPNLISCDDERVKCMYLVFRVKHLRKDGTIKIKIPIKANMIASGLTRKNGPQEVSYIQVVDKQTQLNTVAIWIIVMSVIVALAALVTIIYILKKFNFFNRATHDKLQEERNGDALELNSPESESKEGPSTNAQTEA